MVAISVCDCIPLKTSERYFEVLSSSPDSSFSTSSSLVSSTTNSLAPKPQTRDGSVIPGTFPGWETVSTASLSPDDKNDGSNQDADYENANSDSEIEFESRPQSYEEFIREDEHSQTENDEQPMYNAHRMAIPKSQPPSLLPLQSVLAGIDVSADVSIPIPTAQAATIPSNDVADNDEQPIKNAHLILNPHSQPQPYLVQALVADFDVSADATSGTNDVETPSGRHVRFSTLQIREHTMIMGDNPGGVAGPPLTLSWAPTIGDGLLDITKTVNEKEGTVCSMIPIEDYEASRPPRRTQAEMHMPTSYRVNLLLDTGYSRAEITAGSLEVQRERLQRSRTRNSPTHMEYVQELSEAIHRKTLHVLTLGRKKRLERELLYPEDYSSAAARKQGRRPDRRRLKEVSI